MNSLPESGPICPPAAAADDGADPSESRLSADGAISDTASMAAKTPPVPPVSVGHGIGAKTASGPSAALLAANARLLALWAQHAEAVGRPPWVQEPAGLPPAGPRLARRLASLNGVQVFVRVTKRQRFRGWTHGSAKCPTILVGTVKG